MTRQDDVDHMVGVLGWGRGSNWEYVASIATNEEFCMTNESRLAYFATRHALEDLPLVLAQGKPRACGAKEYQRMVLPFLTLRMEIGI